MLVEVDYWLRRLGSVDAWLASCDDVERGAFTLWPADVDVLVRAARLQARVADQSIGFVDAAVFVTCEILGEDKGATLDRRHFDVLRTDDGRPLDIVPAA